RTASEGRGDAHGDSIVPRNAFAPPPTRRTSGAFDTQFVTGNLNSYLPVCLPLGMAQSNQLLAQPVRASKGLCARQLPARRVDITAGLIQRPQYERALRPRIRVHYLKGAPANIVEGVRSWTSTS